MRSVLDAFQLVPCSNSSPWRNRYEPGTLCPPIDKFIMHRAPTAMKKGEAERLTHPYSKREKRSTKKFEAGENARSSVNLERGTAAKKKRAGSDKAEIQ